MIVPTCVNITCIDKLRTINITINIHDIYTELNMVSVSSNMREDWGNV